MTQKRISVVIPVYNGQKYIRRCIDSVLNQEGFDTQWLDIILINDGSNDTSLDILKIYEGQYPNIIRVFNQENTGVANTRNRGIALASGKYVAFIDKMILLIVISVGLCIKRRKLVIMMLFAPA